MKIISKCKITSPQFLIGYDFVTGRDNICQLNFLPHYQILLTGKYWTMRWIKTASAASSKNPSFADLDRLKLAGEVFAYLAVPVFSREKWGAASPLLLARQVCRPLPSVAGDPWQTGTASWEPNLPALVQIAGQPRRICCPAVFWAGLEAGGRLEGGFLGALLTTSRDGRKLVVPDWGPPMACLQLNCKSLDIWSFWRYLMLHLTGRGRNWGTLPIAN